ncbi:MAG: ribose-phosphate pyrophosphokinase [Bacteroidia bacterium]|nr:ribose-phosphate pyrophosphokinase [Bacteroidia bacterium]MDW8016022.1 ribose-phosphate pyrophosphokinase [Bacteroidia bacterium]
MSGDIPVKIFAGSASRSFAEKVAQHYGQALGQLTLHRFSDGEIQPKYEESIRGAHVCLIQSTGAPADNFMELLLLIDAAKRASAETITAVIPYFGYARQDRKEEGRVSIGAKLVANLLQAAGASRIVTMDLHAGQIQGFFDIPLDNLEASVVHIPYIEKLGLEPLVIVAPDAGGTARARKYARYLHAELALVDKYRTQANQVHSMRLIGDVRGKHTLIVDDLVDTAGTLAYAAELLLQEGALSVRACVTHPVLSGPAYERIANSPLTELIVTDTLPLRQPSHKITVLSVASIFAQALRNIHHHESVSALFFA